MVAPLWAHNQKFVLPEKVCQSSPKLLMTGYPLRPPIVPNFIEIGQTAAWRKALQKLDLGQKKLFCHGQKRDYLSRASHAACERRD